MRHGLPTKKTKGKTETGSWFSERFHYFALCSRPSCAIPPELPEMMTAIQGRCWPDNRDAPYTHLIVKTSQICKSLRFLAELRKNTNVITTEK